MKTGYFTLSFTVLDSGLDVLALIALGLAFADAKFNFDVATFPVTAKRYDRLPFLLGGRPKLHDLTLVKKETTDCLRFMLNVAGLFVWLDVATEKEALKAVNASKGIIDIDVPQTDGFDLRPF
jgi:hypothetical protein